MSKKLVTYTVIMALLVISTLAPGCLPDNSKGSNIYGEPFNMDDHPTVEIAAIINDPDRFTGNPVIVPGRVAQVCPTSGCWLMISDGTHNLLIQLYDFTVKLPGRTEVAVLGEVRFKDGQPYLAGMGIIKQ